MGRALSRERPARAPADVLALGLAELGRELAPATCQALLALAELLGAWAQRMNLTGHRSVEAIVHRLVLDAIALEAVLPPAARIVDLGSGAGFPGLPLALLRPQAEIRLVEARERRHHFQRAAVRRLGLENVRAVRGRAEQLEPRPSEGVVAQALAAPEAALRLALPWAAPGGWIALPGGPDSALPSDGPGVDRVERRSYRVPLEGPERSLWLGWRA